MADDQERVVGAQINVEVTNAINQIKQYSDTVTQARDAMTQRPNGQIWIDSLGGTIQNAILKIENASRRGQISLDDLQKKLMEVQSAYKSAGAFDPNVVGSRNAVFNDKAVIDAANRIQQQLRSVYNQQVSDQQQLLNEWLRAQDQYYKQVESMDKLHYQAIQEDRRRDEVAQQQSIDGQLQRIKAFYDMKLLTAEQALKKIEQLIDEEGTYFATNQDKEIQALKMATSMEDAIYAEQRKAISSTLSGGGNNGRSHINGFGMMNPIDMGAMMVQFTAMNTLLTNVQQGIVGVDKAEANLKQVFGDTVQTQDQLNSTTNDFIDIGKQYGQTVDEVTTAAKQWGRQYKDVQTAMELTRSATILSTVDNLSMADANRALEATMNAMGMAATDQASAITNSSKIVDSWSALAHEASISASDLANGVERSAGAAHQAGMTIDQLNAVISATVRNTGLSGKQKLAPYAA